MGSEMCIRDSDEHGDRPFDVGLHMSTFAWNGPDAWEVIRPHLRYVSWKYEDMEDARLRPGGSPEPPPMTAEQEAALRDEIVLGTPREVADRIRTFEDAAGTDLHFIADLTWPGMDAALQRETMRIFAGEVAPLLR